MSHSWLSAPAASRAMRAQSSTLARAARRLVLGQARVWSPRASTGPPHPGLGPQLPQWLGLSGSGSRRRRRTAEVALFGCEVGGRWSAGAQRFVRDLMRLRALRAYPAMRAAASTGWSRRWWGTLSVAVQLPFHLQTIDGNQNTRASCYRLYFPLHRATSRNSRGRSTRENTHVHVEEVRSLNNGLRSMSVNLQTGQAHWPATY